MGRKALGAVAHAARDTATLPTTWLITPRREDPATGRAYFHNGATSDWELPARKKPPLEGGRSLGGGGGRRTGAGSDAHAAGSGAPGSPAKLAPASSASLSNEWQGAPSWSYGGTHTSAAPRDAHLSTSSHCREGGYSMLLRGADGDAAVAEALGYAGAGYVGRAESGWTTGTLQRVDGALVGMLHSGALKASEHNLDAAARAQALRLELDAHAARGPYGGVRLPPRSWGHARGRVAARRADDDFGALLDTPFHVEVR